MLTDHELTVLVEAGAKGVVNGRAAHHGTPAWEDLPASEKNGAREVALPFIFHGFQALEGLGYEKHREIQTVDGLADLALETVIIDAARCVGELESVANGRTWWSLTGDECEISGQNLNFPVTVLWEPKP